MKKIKLTGKYSKNFYTLVDDEDYGKYNKWKWWLGKDGYVAKSFRKGGQSTIIRLHRMVMNCPKDKVIDHINHNKLDNTKDNLRICSKSENQHNQRIQKRLKSSTYKGVYWDKRKSKWAASIHFKNKKINIGRFNIEVNAAMAYDQKARELFGKFAWLNFKNN